MLAINPKIKQKAEDIRKKIFGSEVRESLASGIEAISEDVEATIGRQDYVEEQFQDVLDETTGKDVISAPELIAARNGKSNLKTRLDDEHAQVTAQLQQTEKETENLSLNKMDKSTTDIGIHQINKNKGLLDETYMTEEFKQQMTGTTPVNAVPAKGSIVQSMHAYPAIEGKESFNKFNPATITPGVYIEGTTGTEVPVNGMNTSDYIKVNPLKKHFISVGESDASLHIAWYNANKDYIGGIAGVSEMGHKNAMVTPPSNAVYARLSVKDSQLTNFLFCESDTYQEYQPFKNVVTVNDLEFKPSERITTKNLFNKNAVTKGKYISFEFGDPRDLLGYNASEFIPVKPMTDYTYLKGFGNPEQLAFYDINKRHISGIAAPDELITTPADAYFVRFTVTNLALDTFLFGEGTVEKYEPYGAFIPKEHLYPDDNNGDETTTLVVAKDGSGGFTSIYRAVSSIVDASKYKPYNVLIHEGEYDVISELPVGMVANPTPAIGNRGLELPPFVNLIGVGIKEKIILKGELLNPTVDQAQYLSTVNYYSSNRLENLTITARNLRYPIHADGNRGACHYTVDNCEVIHYGNDAGLWATCHAFGSGFGSGSRLEMHNSKFTTYGTDNHARAWSTHNWDNLDEPSTVVISECELLHVNDGVAVFFGSLGSGQQESALIKNSYVKGSIVNEENEVGSGAGIEFTVTSYNLATTVISH